MAEHITVLGAGLAGCEAAWQIASRGVPVILYEMKPERFSPAHKSPGFAELVCSNSLKAARIDSAAGLLKEEMRRLGSLLVDCAEKSRVPAGGALAVDREEFSRLATETIEGHPLIQVRRQEVRSIPEGPAVVATGPLTSEALSEEIQKLCGGEALSFFDAAAPIVTRESLDMERCFLASRYEKGDSDYINCPMNQEEYDRFLQELVNAERAPVHSFDVRDPKVYEGCMPIEVLASRGHDAIRYGPMKPVGLRDPKTGRRPWAVLQLRTENRENTLYNLVGFQTNLKFGEQKRVFGMIPGLAHAEFVRYGVMHRNTFLDSPKLLGPDFAVRARPDLFFAGQITGVEGYMESASSGVLAGINAVRRVRGQEPLVLPETTMMGALSRYISEYAGKDFQPMGANFGVLPPLPERVRDKRERYMALSRRALEDLSRAAPEDECKSGERRLEMKIIVDAFGGDNAPKEILLGCAQAMDELGVEILLTGDRARLEAAARELGITEKLSQMEVLECGEVLTMEDEPTSVIKEKTDSSMAVGLRALSEGRGDAFASAGNSGALVVGATMLVKRIRGVKRVSFAPILPKQPGFFMLNDGGANVDCRPEMLLQFGMMGSAYMQKVMGVENPRVGLANVGVEPHKGDDLRREAYALLSDLPEINFVGNVEARDIPFDACDVVVADGFSGNMLVKMYEGAAMAVMGLVKGVFSKNVKSRLAAALVYGDLKGLKKQMDYNEYGGAPIMGAQKPVFKIHGSAKASTVKNALRLTRDYTLSGFVEEIAQAVGKREA